MPGYLRPTAKIFADVLLPADPALALALAQQLLERPLMANHAHGLWGYSGQTAAGRELTIQATGIGGPSAAVVLAELAAHGARRAIRLGRATALAPQLAPGETLVAERALAGDGAGRALAGEAATADPVLSAALAASAGSASLLTIASFDLHYDPGAAARRRSWREAGAVAVDLESAAVLASGAERGIAIACALAIAEASDGRHDEEATEGALLRLGTVATDALAAAGRSPSQACVSGTSNLL